MGLIICWLRRLRVLGRLILRPAVLRGAMLGCTVLGCIILRRLLIVRFRPRGLWGMGRFRILERIALEGGFLVGVEG